MNKPDENPRRPPLPPGLRHFGDGIAPPPLTPAAYAPGFRPMPPPPRQRRGRHLPEGVPVWAFLLFVVGFLAFVIIGIVVISVIQDPNAPPPYRSAPAPSH